jgi:hypothetical protein
LEECSTALCSANDTLAQQREKECQQKETEYKLHLEQERLNLLVNEEKLRVEATEQLNQELQAKLEECNEELVRGRHALEQNRSQNIILEELRHKVADLDRQLRDKDAQVFRFVRALYIKPLEYSIAN